MRSVKYLILMAIVVCTVVGCGGEKKDLIPPAAESMAKNKAVRILTFAVNAPFEFGDGTGVQGFGVAIGNEIAKDLGYEVRWIKLSGVNRMYEVMKEGQAELILSSVAIDPARETEFAYSIPYYETGDVIAYQRSEFDITDLAGLSGKTVGVAEGHPGEALMAAQTGVTIKPYPTLDDALGALNRTEVDAVVGDEPFITYSSAQSYPNTNVLPTLVNKYSYAVAVLKSETELLAKINATIERMKSAGRLAELEAQWMGDAREQAGKRAEGDRKTDEAKRAPKTINVNINKLSGDWKMDRLDGFKFVLEGASGRYESTPILTEGNHGSCRFERPVPPGEYRLNISILRLVTTVPVPNYPKTSLTMDLNIGRDTTIRFR